MRYLNFILLFIITTCLAYIAFFKPLPQRYVFKKTEDNSVIGITSVDKRVFDTATGKLYSLRTSDIVLPDSTKDSGFSFKHTFHNEVFDFINSTYVKRDQFEEIE